MDAGSFGISGIYAATFLLGILHAIEPGHGKTVVAAYLVGTRGRSIDAVVLGMVVTFTHTFSIIALAVAAKFTSRYYSEEVLHSYLGIVSSLIILGIGIWMLRTRWAAMRGGPGTHHHHAGHAHTGGHSHDHGHHHADNNARVLNLKGLMLLGISGGIIPCPAAIAILLASVSTGNMGKGLGLVIIFSAGLAIALVAIGLILVNSLKMGERFMNIEKISPLAALLSAVVITMIGAVTLISSFKHFPF